ncbi:MAG TPA: class I SAM-dependent methyltransferase [Candidatus Tectomicrobia bacterium]|jgi:SAM-dependent methyltransferase
MSVPTTYSFNRYLAAKKSVDDRALNQHVWHSLAHALPAAARLAPVRILEVGAGIGTMVERLVTRGFLTHAAYTAIDADPETIAESQRRLPGWMADQGFSVTEDVPGQWHFLRPGHDLRVETEAIDLLSFMAHGRGQRAWDLLIAHALLDVLDIPSIMPGLLSLLRPGGLFYFTIAFDGATVLQPEIDAGLDTQIEALYHQTMDQRRIAGQPCGDSHTGRHLFSHLQAAGTELIDVGSSDWVIFAGPHGYPGDEAYFLHFIIHTIDTALQGHPQLNPERFAAWIARRHAQVEQGSLVYIAHQLDFLGRVPAPVSCG